MRIHRWFLVAALAAALVSPAVAQDAGKREAAGKETFPPSFTKEARNAVVHAMRAAGLAPRDAGFNKRVAAHPHLLDLVKESLDYPLRVPAQADFIGLSLARTSGAHAFRHAGGLLPEGAWKPSPKTGDAVPTEFPGAPPSLKRLYDAWCGAAALLPEVSAEDWEFLMSTGMTTAGFGEGDGASDLGRLLDAGERLGVGEVPMQVTELVRACEQVVREKDLWLAYGPTVFDRPEEGPEGLPRIVVSGVNGDFLNAAEDEADIVIDLGGNDTWAGRWASGVGEVKVVIDLGGNDRWEAPDEDFVLGAGVCGIGILVDAGGNDLYRGRHGSLGMGWNGLGLLLDLGGDDLYDSGTFGQGAGLFGTGMLRDESGSDRYLASMYAQGFARTKGVGVLQDRAGNDSYFAGGKVQDSPDRWGEGNTMSLAQGYAIGFRPTAGNEGAAGGIGVLMDEGNGADFYTVDVYGQGCSYWYSLGVLMDGGGNDSYTAQQYAQGSGIHLSTGILVDRGGMDRYQCIACCQGQGHDLAVGWLIDMEGSDYYSAKDLCQGAGSANGVGFHVDYEGDDAYMSRQANRGQPYGNPRRGWGSIGIVVDLAGTDTWSGHLRDGEGWVGSTWAAGMDLAEGQTIPDYGDIDETPVRDPEVTASKGPEPGPAPKAPAAGTPQAEVLALFKRATIRDSRKAEDKKIALAELRAHPDALSFLVNRLDLYTRFTRGVYSPVAESAGVRALDVLKAALKYEEIAYRRRVMIQMVGATKAKEALPLLENALLDTRPEVRAEACTGLGKVGDEAAVKTLVKALDDSQSSVRLAAINALGRMSVASTPVNSRLAEFLSSAHFQERFRAASVLASPETGGWVALTKAARSNLGLASIVAARALAGADPKATRTVSGAKVLIRTMPALLAAAELEGTAGDVEELSVDELKDPFLRGAVRRAQENHDR